jgi:hypothetical protein
MRARTSAFLRGLRSQSGAGSAVVPAPDLLSLSPDQQAGAASPAEPGDAAVYNARAWRMDAQNTTFPEEVRPTSRRD